MNLSLRSRLEVPHNLVGVSLLPSYIPENVVRRSRLHYVDHRILQAHSVVKLHGVFFSHWTILDCSLGCRFAPLLLGTVGS